MVEIVGFNVLDRGVRRAGLLDGSGGRVPGNKEVAVWVGEPAEGDEGGVDAGVGVWAGVGES